MINYNLSELIGNDKDIELPAIVERLSSEREYRRLMRTIIRDARQSIIDDVLPTYALSISDGAMITDGFFTSAADLVVSLREKMRVAALRVSLSASILINSEARSLDSKFVAGVKAKTKFDVSGFVRPDDQSILLRKIVERNTALITSLTDETVEKITQAVIDAQIKGLSKAQLKDELSKILGKQAKRADLIASDQMEKLAADIIAERTKQAGLNIYIWVSLMDGRERSYHNYLNGRRQDTRNINHGDKGLFPRQPIRCRCRAKWIIGGRGSNLY